jgi:hypothetical protein
MFLFPPELKLLASGIRCAHTGALGIHRPAGEMECDPGHVIDRQRVSQVTKIEKTRSRLDSLGSRGVLRVDCGQKERAMAGDERPPYHVAECDGRHEVRSGSGRVIVVCHDPSSAQQYVVMLNEAWRLGYKAGTSAARSR